MEEFILDRDTQIVTYVDDSYIILEAKDCQELKLKTEACMADHDGFQKTLGMRTNIAKMEAIVFSKDPTALELEVNGQKIITEKTIKVLGILFSHNLSWSPHVEKVVSKAVVSWHGKTLSQNLVQETDHRLRLSLFPKVIFWKVGVGSPFILFSLVF